MNDHGYYRSEALNFCHMYAEGHEFFTGGDLLHAYREAKMEGAPLDWRNKWASQIVNEGERKGWWRRAGKVRPTTKQSHTASLTQWQSMLYKGPQSIQGTTAREEIEKIRKEYIEKKAKGMDLRQALWKAYEFGIESRERDKT